VSNKHWHLNQGFGRVFCHWLEFSLGNINQGFPSHNQGFQGCFKVVGSTISEAVNGILLKVFRRHQPMA
jgi:hypothetical protein